MHRHYSSTSTITFTHKHCHVIPHIDAESIHSHYSSTSMPHPSISTATSFRTPIRNPCTDTIHPQALSHSPTSTATSFRTSMRNPYTDTIHPQALPHPSSSTDTSIHEHCHAIHEHCHIHHTLRRGVLHKHWILEEYSARCSSGNGNIIRTGLASRRTDKNVFGERKRH